MDPIEQSHKGGQEEEEYVETSITITSSTSSGSSTTHTHTCAGSNNNVKKARAQEKESLCDLNNRLAGYIEKVRYLEAHNGKLSTQITEIQEARTRELTLMKETYDSELTETRRVLDDTSKERAVLKLETSKLNGILVDLREKLEQEVSSNKQLSLKLRKTELISSEKETLLTVYSNEKFDLETKVSGLESQLSNLETQLAADKEQLEKEIIARIDAENRYQTVREESQFQAQVYKNEINELRRASAARVEAIAIECTGHVDYEGMIRVKLQELREEFRCEAETSKQELEDAYRLRLEQMKEQSDKDRSTISNLVIKQSDFGKMVEELRSEKSSLLMRYEHAEKRIQEINSERMKDKEQFQMELEERRVEREKTHESFEQLRCDYQSLLGIKVQLDMELSAYNKLLQGEEERLNHLHESSTSSSKSSVRSCRKRGYKRAMEGSSSEQSITSSAIGSVSFGDIDIAGGKFVSIANTGDEDIQMGEFTIEQTIDGASSNSVFTFPSEYILSAQQSVTVWSNSFGMKANDPTDYVLDGGDWSFGGDCVRTCLSNKEKEVVAQHTVSMSRPQEASGMQTRSKKCSKDSCSFM